jgi:hypothetical protein
MRSALPPADHLDGGIDASLASEPVTHTSGNIRPRILLLPVSGASFQEGKRDRRGSGRSGATVTACIADTYPYLQILRERLGKVIE